MRDVPSVINSLKDSLKSISSPLANFSNYSNIYAIFRAFASVIVEQNNLIDSYKSSRNLLNAVEEDLDILGIEYGMFRDSGDFGVGNVLAVTNTNTSVSLPKDTVLTHLESNTQFKITQSYIVNTVEIPLPVVSLDKRSDVNLIAGTKLVSSFYPNVTFTVGSYRDSRSIPQEGIRGGRGTELDESFRLRILDHNSGIEKGTISSIYVALRNLGINKIYIKEHSPVTGYLAVYVDTSNEDKLREVEREINRTKAAGTAYILRPLEILYIDLTIVVRLSNLDRVAITTNLIRQAVSSYLQDIEFTEILNPSAIASIVMTIEGVSGVSVGSISNPIILPIGYSFNLRNLSINIQN